MKRLIERLLAQKLTRYLLVGGAAFGIEYTSFLAMYIWLGWKVYVANAISFGLGLLTSFLLNRLWTFEDKTTYHYKPAHQFVLYTSLAIANLLATVGLVQLLQLVGIEPLIGKFAAMVTTSLWNYILFKLFVFKHATYQRPDNHNSKGKTHGPETD